MKTTNPQPEEIKLHRMAIKAILILGLTLLSLMQVWAFATDTVLLKLEESFDSSNIYYAKTQESLLKAKELVEAAKSTRCSTYKALKAYKESKNIALKDETFNPCTEGEQVAVFPQAEPTSPKPAK